MKTPCSDWHPGSWRGFPAFQQPSYDDGVRASDYLAKLKAYPPLVFHGEVDTLKRQLADAQAGKRFLLQGGDCAERFMDSTPEAITTKLKILLQMSVVLGYGGRCPVIKVGRMAGQYAKPRSSEFEDAGSGEKIPVYRGDLINSFECLPEARLPNPGRLLESYHCASSTLNYIRALIGGGFADLRHPEHWNLSFLGASPYRERYGAVASEIKRAAMFMASSGLASEGAFANAEFFTSHEGFLLGYEEALTRFVPEVSRHYNLSAHMLWLGDRSRQESKAHLEYFRGIANPIGIKVGPDHDPMEIADLVDEMNPYDEPGKITLITLFADWLFLNKKARS